MKEDLCHEDEVVVVWEGEKEVRGSVCLLCQEELHLGHEGGTCYSSSSGESGVSLKNLFRYLKVDLCKIPLEPSVEEGREGLRKEGKCWTEEKVIASGICEDCDLLVELFGVKYKEVEAALKYMKQSIQKLEERLQLNNNCNPVPGATRDAPGDGLTKYYNLKVEILKMCELKLKAKLDDELLPSASACVRKQEESAGGGGDVSMKDKANKKIRKLHSNSVKEEEDIVDIDEGDHHQLNDCRKGGGQGQPEQGQMMEMEGAQEEDSNSSLDDDNPNPAGERTMINDIQRTTSPPKVVVTSTIETRKCECPHCGFSFLGPKSLQKRHLMCTHTLEYFPEYFAGFTQEQVDQVIEELCRHELLTNNAEDRNTFVCSFCETTGRESDKKFHLVSEHLDIVKSRLVVSQKEGAENNLEGESTEENFVTISNLVESEVLKQGKKNSKADRAPPPPMGLSSLVQKVHSHSDDEPQEPLVEDHHDDMPEPLPSTSTQLLEIAPPSPPELMEVDAGNTGKLMEERLRVRSDFQQKRDHFKSNPTAQPDVTLAFLIKEAIIASGNSGLNRGEICGWIQSNFAYYRESQGITSKSLKNTISTTLSSDKKCFQRVKLGDDGMGWSWKVKNREFYKSGRNWAKTKSRKSASNKQSTNYFTLNVKTERTDQSDLNSEEPQPGPSHNNNVQQLASSSSSSHHQRKRNKKGTNIRKNERGGANKSSKFEVLSSPPRPGVVTSSMNCKYCKKTLAGPKSNLDRHEWCVHSVKHVPELVKLGTIAQSVVNNAVSTIIKQSITTTASPSGKGKAYRCTLCVEVKERAGDSKYHILTTHLPIVLSQLGAGTDSRAAALPAVTNYFDESLASSDLQSHIKQERVWETMESDAESDHTIIAPSSSSETVQRRDLKRKKNIKKRITLLPSSSKTPGKKKRGDKAKICELFQDDDRVYWQTAYREPPFSYSSLIQKAIRESPEKRLMDEEICKWLKENFGYFRTHHMTKLKDQVSQALSSEPSCFARVGTYTAGEEAWRVVSRKEEEEGNNKNNKKCDDLSGPG